MKNLIGVTAGIIIFASLFIYIGSILRGGTKPQRATWFIWTLACLMLGLSHYDPSGGNASIWVPVVYVIGPGLVAILSIWYGEGGWTRTDKICIAGCLFSIIPWIFVGREASLVINLVIDFFGTWPTLAKVYRGDKSESKLAWNLSTVGNILNLFAIEKWSFANSAYLIYLAFWIGVITLLLNFRKSNIRLQTP